MVETLFAGMSSETLPSPPVSGQIARFPYSVNFLVEDAKGLLRDGANVRHAQELFAVTVCSIPSQHPGPGEWITIGGGSQESVERAQCYVLAMCHPEVHSDLCCGRSLHRLARLLWGSASSTSLCSVLEKSSLVHIQLLPGPEGSGVIRVQGRQRGVLDTTSRLQNMVDTIESEHSPPSPLTPSLSPPPPTTSSSSLHVSPPLNSLPIEGVDILKALTVLSQEDKQALRAGHDPQPPLMSRSSVEPDMQRKIDYYVRNLGYPQDKVEATLDSLGPKASVNDVINRLNKVSSGGHSAVGCSVGVVKPQPTPVMDYGVRPGTEYVRPIGLEEAGSLVGVAGERFTSRGGRVDSSKLRPVVIDGSNVAMRHGNGQVFSCRGIQLVVDYFRNRGHDHIKVFVPEWRKESSRPETPISDQHILDSLEKEGVLHYTPSRKISGRRIICYDDRFIIKYAHMEGGVIVSNDQYRDLMQEDTEWRRVIEQHLLQFVFAGDHFMPPDDPLGKTGPTLDAFLRKDPREQHVLGNKKVVSDSRTPICPHLGNCTFGRKCRYFHPDREPPQKAEHAGGSGGSSGGSYTPSTSSRSATPSPSPESRGGGHLGAGPGGGAKEMYGGSRYSSSDDLYTRNSEISELAEHFSQISVGLAGGSPTKHPYTDPYHAPQGGTAPLSGGSRLSIKLAPPSGQVKTAPTSGVGVAGEVGGGRPHNYTFPLTQGGQLSRVNPRLTEEHSYQRLNHTHQPPSLVHNHSHAPQVPYEDGVTFAPHHPHPHHHQDRGVGPHASQPLLPRGQVLYPQAGDYPGGVVDPTYARRDVHAQHVSSSSSSSSSSPRYRTRVGVVDPAYPSHQAMNSYDQHRVICADQSISIHNLHQQHLSPNHHHNHHHHQQLYMQPRPLGPTPQQGQYPPEAPGYTRPNDGYQDPRLKLLRMADAALPGCEGRIRHVMQRHPKLSGESEKDFETLVELVKAL